MRPIKHWFIPLYNFWKKFQVGKCKFPVPISSKPAFFPEVVYGIPETGTSLLAAHLHPLANAGPCTRFQDCRRWCAPLRGTGEAVHPVSIHAEWLGLEGNSASLSIKWFFATPVRKSLQITALNLFRIWNLFATLPLRIWCYTEIPADYISATWQ